MYEASLLIVEHQSILTVLSFIFGCGALLYIARRSTARTWRKVDLIWVSVGGSAAILAVLSTLYLSKESTLVRRIDILKSAMNSGAQESQQFTFRYCSEEVIITFYSPAINIVCSRGREIAFSIKNSSRAQILASVVEVGSLADLKSPFQKGVLDETIYSNFDGVTTPLLPGTDLADEVFFDPLDVETENAIEVLRRSELYTNLIADFAALVISYRMIANIYDNLYEAWHANRFNYIYVALRVLSVMALCFVFPLRFGKSWFELRQGRLP
ncbi:hypothetical protein [Tabrizicola sp. BL-A-41-H6]|uniref:hypothetical protein n=1 Tax=Tabrizicola sp. BL-A-41-H6 TaxID=3421107 RepID=UPI003D6713C2